MPTYVVAKKTLVRAGSGMDSPKAEPSVLRKGARVVSTQEVTLPCGTVRVEYGDGCWVSKTAKDGSTILSPGAPTLVERMAPAAAAALAASPRSPAPASPRTLLERMQEMAASDDSGSAPQPDSDSPSAAEGSPAEPADLGELRCIKVTTSHPNQRGHSCSPHPHSQLPASRLPNCSGCPGQVLPGQLLIIPPPTHAAPPTRPRSCGVVSI
jgi:hypothetical protein